MLAASIKLSNNFEAKDVTLSSNLIHKLKLSYAKRIQKNPCEFLASAFNEDMTMHASIGFNL